jgi:hypothetical protein
MVVASSILFGKQMHKSLNCSYSKLCEYLHLFYRNHVEARVGAWVGIR